MRLRFEHVKFLGNKIAIDLLNSGFVKLTQGIEPVAKIAQEVLEEDIEIEEEINEKARELVEEREEDIDFFQADRRELFWMIKKRIAEDEKFNLRWDDRLSDIAHIILNELYEEDLINYSVSDNRVKNVIFKAMEDFLKKQDEIVDIVHEKISHYKRPIHYGSEEYDIIFNKLYEEELRKIGL